MLSFEQIVGHKSQKDRIQKLKDTDQLPHAMCFSGPSGVGKRLIALALFDQIADGDYHRYPDKWELEREINPKTKKLKKNISAEQIRNLKLDLASTSLSGGKKLVIINNAELLSTAAQNSLLKTLEEPRGDTHIVLVTSSAAMLLPTILSRAVTIEFTRVAESDIDSLLSLETDDKKRALASALSFGIPARAIECLSTDPTSQLDESVTFLQSGVSLRFAQITALTKLKSKKAVKDHIESCRILLQNILEVQAGRTPKLASTKYSAFLSTYREQPISRTTRALAILGDVQTAINHNCSPSIALEHFALSL